MSDFYYDINDDKIDYNNENYNELINDNIINDNKYDSFEYFMNFFRLDINNNSELDENNIIKIINGCNLTLILKNYIIPDRIVTILVKKIREHSINILFSNINFKNYKMFIN